MGVVECDGEGADDAFYLGTGVSLEARLREWTSTVYEQALPYVDSTRPLAALERLNA